MPTQKNAPRKTVRKSAPKPRKTASSSNGSKTVGINVQLPEALHKNLRVKALGKSISLTDAVTQAVQAWVKGR